MATRPPAASPGSSLTIVGRARDDPSPAHCIDLPEPSSPFLPLSARFPGDVGFFFPPLG